MFFKAGVLAQLEEMRDKKLAAIMLGFQAMGRWFAAQKETKRRRDQLAGYTILQRNIRAWCTLRTWEWFKLYGHIKPLLKAGKKDAVEMEKFKVATAASQVQMGTPINAGHIDAMI